MKKIFTIMLALLLTVSLAGFGSVGSERNAAKAAGESSGTRDEGISLCPSALLLPMFSSSSGEKLRVMQDGEQVSSGYFRWVSSNTSVVRVNQNGSLTAVAPGTAVVYITDDGETVAQSTVTVVSDSEFNTLHDLEPMDMSLPFYSQEVGIGPLGGGVPVILKRFINPPSCGDQPEPDPNAFIASEGWTYTYAVIYRVHVSNGQSIRFIASPSTAQGPHASNAYICVYDCYFNLWEYSKGTTSNPYGQVTLNSYEDNDFYLVITPISHTDDSASGNICLYAYDVTAPYAQGDVNLDHSVTSADALCVLRHIMGLGSMNSQGTALADMNGDGSVTSDDALMILRGTMGLM